MGNFDDLVSAADSAIMNVFSDTFRWTKTDTSTRDITGIIDLDIELYGDSHDIIYQGKAVTVYASDIPGFKAGETLTLLDADGNPTATVYKLQRTLKSDGHLKIIEIS